MFLVWFMNSRQREMVRRTTSCALVVLYLLVATAANLFHTEIYDQCPSRNPATGCIYSQTDSGDLDVNFTAGSSNQLRLASMGDFCPVCVFFKTHQSQTSQTPDLISVNTPPAYIFGAVELFIPHKHPLPALPTRGPPAVVT